MIAKKEAGLLMCGLRNGGITGAICLPILLARFVCYNMISSMILVPVRQ